MTYSTLLVDMQSCSEYMTDSLAKVVDQQLRLLQFSRGMGFTVFVANMMDGPKMISRLQLEVEKGNHIYLSKTKPNSFIETGLEYLFRSERTTKVILAGHDRDICCLETAKGIANSKRKVVTSLDLLSGAGINSESLAERKYGRLGKVYQGTDELIAAVRTEVQP